MLVEEEELIPQVFIHKFILSCSKYLLSIYCMRGILLGERKKQTTLMPSSSFQLTRNKESQNREIGAIKTFLSEVLFLILKANKARCDLQELLGSYLIH